MGGEHRGIGWDVEVSDSYECAQVADSAGWFIETPGRRGSHLVEADAIRSCDWLADLRDGIDLRAHLAAVTAERDEARESVSALHAQLYAAWAERDAERAGVRARVDSITAERDAARAAVRSQHESMQVVLEHTTAQRDAARAALAAASIRARVGRVVLGAFDRLRGGGE